MSGARNAEQKPHFPIHLEVDETGALAVPSFQQQASRCEAKVNFNLLFMAIIARR